MSCSRCGSEVNHCTVVNNKEVWVCKVYPWLWKEKVNTPENPKHYSDLDPEPLHVIESWGLPFHEAQVLKYISRAGKKVGPGETTEQKRLEDLKKARVYLERRIKQLEGVKDK